MTRFLKNLTSSLTLLTTLLTAPAMALSGGATEIGVNKSVILDLKKPVLRCESSDSAIASCSSVSPTLLQISGVSPGQSNITVWDEKGGTQLHQVLVKELKEIGLHKSITLDSKKPFKRWQTTTPGIVKFYKISPTRLQIIGTSVGESSLSIWDRTGGKQSFDLSVLDEAKSIAGERETSAAHPASQHPDPVAPHKTVLRPEPATSPILSYEIPLHKNQKIELKKPIQRCESADPAVVECVKISQKQLLINSLAMGKVSLSVWYAGGGKQIINIHVKGYKEIVLPKSFIELPKPVQRCEPANPSILECVRISPTQLQLNGVNGSLLGETSLTVWEEGGSKQIYDIHVKGVEIALNKIEVIKLEFPSVTPSQAELTLPVGSSPRSKDLPDHGQSLHVSPIIADRNIATIIKSNEMPISSKMSNGRYQANLIIRGLKIGETSLILMEGEGKSQSYDIRIKPDLSQLEQQIHEVAPLDQITVTYANETLLLSGKATNERTVAKVVLLAKAYATKGESGAESSGSGNSGGGGSGSSSASEFNLEATNKLSSNMHRSKIDSMNIDRLVQMSQEGKDTSYKIVNLIQIDNPQQVMLEVKVAQVDKTAMKELGVTTFVKGASAETFTDTLGKMTGSFPGALSAALDPYQVGIALFKPGIAAALQALVTKNQAKILAEPNLLVKSGQDGHFLAGQKIPLSVISNSGGTSTTTIIYEPIGVKLLFKPEVMENGIISLTIDPAEVSNISSYLSNGYPVIDSREVRTSVQLRDGESLIMAGLLTEETIKTMSKIPLAGDIPILGALFRSTKDELRGKELVFFITPRLVTPTAQGVKIPLPTDAALTPEQQADFQWMPHK